MVQPAPSSSFPTAQGPITMVRKPRTHVLCFDGTASAYDTQNTNVVKFYSMLKKDRVEDQMCYYQAGIGTYYKTGVVRPLFRWGAKILDEAFAWYLSAHVCDGYRFLMQNYNAGDKVCLFGYSRGAYTARALAGMLHKVGLLSKDNDEQLSFAYKMYASDKASDAALAVGFKQTFSRDVPIEFLGVWETVASVGLIMSRTLPFVASNTTIKTFRQALALDEHRASFRPNTYHRPAPDAGAPPTLKSRAQHVLSAVEQAGQKIAHAVALDGGSDAGDNRSTASEAPATDVDEVWFAGCHSDVGGGAVPDTAAHALGDIPLRWMVREVVRAQCGVLFDDAACARSNVSLAADPGSISSGNGASDGSETTAVGGAEGGAGRDAGDMAQPMYDSLKKNPLWWILEVIPTKYYWQDEADKWVTGWSIHLGRGRWVPEAPRFHESVRLREADKTLKYTPRAWYVKGSETYVA